MKSASPRQPQPGNSQLPRAAVRPPKNPRPEARSKIRVTHARDAGEREADRVADVVLSSRNPSATAAPVQVARAGTDAAPASVDAVIAKSGTPLPNALRMDMEQRFASDFSKVRIHSDSAAQHSARELHANAYTVGNHLVFGAGRFEPAMARGRGLIAHELAHVLQQTRVGTTGVLQRDDAADTSDQWQNLSLAAREIAEEIYWDCYSHLGALGEAQAAHDSVERRQWINDFAKHLGHIGTLDHDSKVEPAERGYKSYVRAVTQRVQVAQQGWKALKKRYLDEYEYLTRRSTSDNAQAAKHLQSIYTQTKRWLDAGAEGWLTEDDFLELKLTLDNKRHVTVGVLRSSRHRVEMLRQMLDVIAELRYAGEDAEKFVPGWETRVSEELAHLARLASGTEATTGFDYPREFKQLREELDRRYRNALKAHKPEKSVLEKGGAVVSGVVDAVVSPFIEAAKQLVDLVQICMHFATLGKYEPSFTSDMSKAAKQGATTGDLLKGMVTGLIETPERLYKAIRDGDWEAIGRETANLYMLYKSAKQLPEFAASAAAKLARTRQAFRLLKARKVAIELHESRILLQKQQTLAPPKIAHATETPLYLKSESPPTQGFRSKNQEPATTRVDDTSKPVQGFRGKNQDPATTRVDDTSKPVQGFRGKNQDPAKARTDKPDTVPNDMPPAREVTGGPLANKGATAQRRDQGAIASTKKSDGAPQDGKQAAQASQTDARQPGKTADDRMARMERAGKDQREREARRKDLEQARENQAPKKEPVEKTKDEIKAERKAQRLQQKEQLQNQLADNRERQLQLYTEIERANQSAKRPMSDKARTALEARKSDLVREAQRNLEARQGLETSIVELEITPYDRARAYSYSDAAGQSVVKRAAGRDEMSGKAIREPSIDHIVPVEDIVNLDGYLKLHVLEQRALLNNQHNLRLMEKGANSSKGRNSWKNWEEGRRIYGDTIADRMIVLEANLRKQLQGMIITMLAERGVRL